MKVARLKDVPKESHATPLFTGPQVTMQVLAPGSQDFSVNMVNFGKGVRNKFHTHSSDQVLIVTAGTGYVATDKETRKVTVGDVILVPVGEKHWHGAGAEGDFSHISVTRPGSKLTQLEQ